MHAAGCACLVAGACQASRGAQDSLAPSTCGVGPTSASTAVARARCASDSLVRNGPSASTSLTTGVTAAEAVPQPASTPLPATRAATNSPMRSLLACSEAGSVTTRSCSKADQAGGAAPAAMPAQCCLQPGGEGCRGRTGVAAGEGGRRAELTIGWRAKLRLQAMPNHAAVCRAERGQKSGAQPDCRQRLLVQKTHCSITLTTR